MIPDQSSALLTSSEQCPLQCWPTCFLEGNTPLVFWLLGSPSYLKLCPQNQFTCESLCNCIGTLVCSIECPFQAQHIPQSLKRQDHKELYRTSNEEERGIVEELEFKTFTIKFKHFEIWCTVPKSVWMKPSSASSISLAMGLSGHSLRTRHILDSGAVLKLFTLQLPAKPPLSILVEVPYLPIHTLRLTRLLVLRSSWVHRLTQTFHFELLPTWKYALSFPIEHCWSWNPFVIKLHQLKIRWNLVQPLFLRIKSLHPFWHLTGHDEILRWNSFYCT